MIYLAPQKNKIQMAANDKIFEIDKIKSRIKSINLTTSENSMHSDNGDLYYAQKRI